MSFIGRKDEFKVLVDAMNAPKAKFIVVRGRRRIGKSRLIEEFAKAYQFFHFAGVMPNEKTTAQIERDEFVNQMVQYHMPKPAADDWNNLFWMLAEKSRTGKVVILLDEISWMGTKDPHFLGKLKNAWDMHLKKNDQLMLILCGSASSWIEKNILSSTGFLGRISKTLVIDELPLRDCQKFWGKQSHHISPYEKLKLLSVTGGVPRYLEEVDPALSADENIKRLCFTKGSLLLAEFDQIFEHVFLRKSPHYRAIVELLSSGVMSHAKICDILAKASAGRVLEYLNELVLSGYITRDYQWHLHNGLDGKLSKFRLSDNYLRFYLKYIDKNKSKILRDAFNFRSLSSLPGWYSMMGYQFENLVLNNRVFLHRQLGLDQADIVSENPFFQRKTSKQPGVQLDYLIQTRFDTLYVCEIKFSKHAVSNAVIDEMKTKISRLKKPRNFSCRPVLIHVNGVDEGVVDSGFFSHIVDFKNVFSD